MYWLRKWSVRHARLLETTYSMVERCLVIAAPLLRHIGDDRLEKPVAAVEKVIKGALFDCQMCGQCVLTSTGMSCPMNCPKSIRNGPCGGVRANGYCEINALCLGGGLGRCQPHENRFADQHRAVCGRSSPQGAFLLAACGSRTYRGLCCAHTGPWRHRSAGFRDR